MRTSSETIETRELINSVQSPIIMAQNYPSMVINLSIYYIYIRICSGISVSNFSYFYPNLPRLNQCRIIHMIMMIDHVK